MDLFSLKVGFFYILYPLIHRLSAPGSWKKTGTCESYSITETGDTVICNLDKGKLMLTAITPAIFRVMVLRDTDPDYVTFSAVYNETIPVKADEKNRFVHIKPASHTGMEVLFDLNSTGISFSFYNQMLHSETQSACFNKKWVSSTKFAPVKEKYLGFGQKTGPLFKNMKTLKMWNFDDPRVSQNSDPLYQSCPFMIGLREDGFAHGIFFDNSSFSYFRLDKNKTSTKAFYAAKEGPLCYYVIGGPALKDVVKNFTLLTGRYSLPPRWVLGHHHSRWIEDESGENIKALGSEFRQHKIPCDVLHIDIGHMRGYRCFTWNPDTFPRPEEMVESLHKEKFKVVIIADPGIKKDEEFQVYKQGVEKGYFCTDKDGKVYHASVWPGKCGFVDYSNPEARKWWGSLFEFYTRAGIDGFWNDMNEPSLFYTHQRTLPDSIIHKGGGDVPRMTHSHLHNSYGLLMAKATAEGLDTLRPGMRKFLFCRSSFAGIQHYASTWTGDNTSDWIHLRLSVPMILNMGLSGQTMTGPDIGGFWKDCSSELMIRWMQIGAFYPFCRNHTSNHTIPQEIWKLGKQTLEISRKYLILRYTLLPYLYTYLRESCETGIPLMRPLFLEYPADPRCAEPGICETQFFNGPLFLIAPVLYPGKVGREVYLPKGDNWYDFHTHLFYEGGRTIDCEAPLDVMPIFIKAGAVIPMSPPGLVTDDMEEAEIIFSVYEAEKMSGLLYIDDGKSMKYRDGEYSLLLCEGHLKKNYNRASTNVEEHLKNKDRGSTNVEQHLKNKDRGSTNVEQSSVKKVTADSKKGTSLAGKIKLQCRRIRGDMKPVLSRHPFITFLIYFEKRVEKIESVILDGRPLDELSDNKSGWKLSENSLQVVIKEIDLPFTLDVHYTIIHENLVF